MAGFRYFLAAVILFLFGCDSHEEMKENISVDSAGRIAAGVEKSNTWISSFTAFREAVQQNDRQKVKSFFDFPIMGEPNEIWFVADQDIDSSSTEDKTAMPFTEKDFDKYYAQLFPEMFMQSLRGVNADSLWLKGEYDTIDYKDGETVFNMFSSFDKNENILYLNLATKTPINREEADGMEFSEFNILYQFKVDKNGSIKFKQINLAG
jgi:hypothetical protein